MKNFFIKWTAVIISVIAVVVSFWNVIPTATTTGETFIGVMVSFVAFLATFIVGLQIYNTMDVKEKLKEVERYKEEMQTAVEKSKYELRSELCNNQGSVLLIQKRFVEAIALCLESLHYAIKCEQSGAVKTNRNVVGKAIARWKEDNGYNVSEALKMDGEHALIFAINRIGIIAKECGHNPLYKEIEKDLDEIKEYLEEKRKEI